MTETIRVLMVDDEDQFRATTKRLLERRGYETILAGSGEEAVRRLDDNPDVVILDIKMPGMDGHQALKEIKLRSPDLPVIILTGHGAVPSAREALNEGAFDYLAKPCDMDILAGKITDAYRHGKKSGVREEKCVRDVMLPIGDYTSVRAEQCVGDAVRSLIESFTTMISSSRIIETAHRSILVVDEAGEVRGILVIRDILKAMMPAYLSAPKPTMADSIQYSPMFWRGMFSRQVAQVASMKIGDIMSPVPLSVDGDANLMEAAHMMAVNGVRGLTVVVEKKVVGVVREHDLLFAMEGCLGR